MDRLVGGCCLGQNNEVIDFDFRDETALAAEAVEAPNEFAFDGEVHTFGAEFFDHLGPAAPGSQQVPLAALAHDAVGVQELFFGGKRKAHELFATMKEFELTQQRMVEHYQKTTKQSIEVIREKFLPAHDVWLSAEEALKLNICDHVDYLRK